MWNWRHIWCQTIDVNVIMLNWRHIWCQTVDVNLMSRFGQVFDDFSKKSFSRSMSWCEIDVIFDVKLLMQCFDVKLMSYLMSNCWCQFDVNFWSRFWWFLEKSFSRSMSIDVKITSYLMSNYWCQCFDVKLHHIRRQTNDVNDFTLF